MEKKKSKEKRLLQIIDVLKKSETVSTRELSALLNVSEMTVRRDLELLERDHIVDRKHGGAVLKSPSSEYEAEGEVYDLSRARVINVKEKTNIARYAASVIEPDDLIFMDNGTTVSRIVPYLPREFQFTVLTYNAVIMFGLLNYRNIKVIFTGGYYYPEDQMFSSDQSGNFIKRHRATKSFISASGVHESLGITCINAHSVISKRALLDASATRILLTDSSKFGVVKSNHFADLDEFDEIITDSNLPQHWIDTIKEHDIELRLV